MRIVYFMLHVPKCAGTTVESHFHGHLGSRYLLAPRWENPLRNFVGNRYPGLTASDLSDVTVVSGHSLSANMAALLPGAEIREAVLLRDPLGYLLSFYNYRWTRHDTGHGPVPPGFEDWYAAQRRNPISRFLLNRYFCQAVPALYRMSSAGRLSYLETRLGQFHFVGSYRHAAEMIGQISRELGIPDEVKSRNVTPARRITRDDLSPALVDRIARENALDQCLYSRWKDRKWSGVPDGKVPELAAFDQFGYLLGDTATGIRKKFV